MFGLGGQEVFWLLLIGLILFGGKKLPELARSMGQAVREFRRVTREFNDAINIDDDRRL